MVWFFKLEVGCVCVCVNGAAAVSCQVSRVVADSRPAYLPVRTRMNEEA